MRSSAEIMEKMDLLNSKNWPPARASWLILRDYRQKRKPSRPEDLLRHLREYVELNWSHLQARDVDESALAHARVQTVIWMMGNNDLLEGLSRMPQSGLLEGIENRLRVVCKHYSLPTPGEQSEDDNGSNSDD